MNSTSTVATLAVTRRQILDHYSDDQADQLIAVEAAIITAPHEADADRQIKRGIIHENGEPDWNDRFIQKLALSLC